MNKLLLITFCFCFLGFQAIATTTTLESEIKRVTLFGDGAEIHRVVKDVLVEKGQNEILLKGISTKVDPKSLSITVTDGSAKVLSHTLRDNEEDLPHISRMKSNLENVNDKINELNSYKRGYERERAILEKNNVILKGQLAVSLFQLKRTAKFYRERFKAINDTLHVIEKSLKVKNRERRKLRDKLDKLQVEAPMSEIALQVKADMKNVCEFHISYRVKEAYWKANYTFRAKNLQAPVFWEYQAQVYNNTGVAWKNVSLRLGTSSIWGTKLPSIGELDLNKNKEEPEIYELIASTNEEFVFDMLLLEDSSKQQKPTPLAVQDSLKKDKNVACTVENDLLLKNILTYISPKTTLKDSTKKTLAAVDSTKSAKKMQRMGRGVEFLIPSTYTIKSNGEFYTLDIVKERLKAHFKHFCIPKLDPTVFLLAKITEWDGLNLLDGTINIYYENRYIGESFVTRDAMDKGLELSLGADANVNIKRTEIKLKQRKQMFSNVTKERLAYKIDVTNNCNQAINIEILDQIPYVTFDKIEVVNVDVKDGVKDERKGQVKWTYTLEPDAMQTMEWAFTMKYKGKHLPVVDGNLPPALIEPNFTNQMD